jgi:hypothetical protein
MLITANTTLLYCCRDSILETLPQLSSHAAVAFQGYFFNVAIFLEAFPVFSSDTTMCIHKYIRLPTNAHSEQGCQIFLGTRYQNEEKYTK